MSSRLWEPPMSVAVEGNSARELRDGRPRRGKGIGDRGGESEVGVAGSVYKYAAGAWMMVGACGGRDAPHAPGTARPTRFLREGGEVVFYFFNDDIF